MVSAILAVFLGASTTMWAGHQVVWSQVHIPLLGERSVRSDAWVLAEVHEDGSTIRWSERPCRLQMGKVAGVRTRIPQATLNMLDATDVCLEESHTGQHIGAWRAQWPDEDIDGDGHPGVTLDIDAPLCGGQVYVAMNSMTRAEAHRFGEDLLGEMKIDVAQRVLGASNACLRWGGKDSLQAQRGVFRYAPVGATSCAEVKVWPDAAPEDRVE